MSKIAILTPPSPPLMDIDRQAAGGMGLCKASKRTIVGHSDYAQYDLPLLSTAGVFLDAGHEVEYIDGQAEKLDEKGFASRVAATRPDYLIGMVQFVCQASDLDLLDGVKSACRGAKLIVVGSTTKVALDEIFKHEAVDYAVLGEPELPTLELVQALESGTAFDAIAGLAWRSEGGFKHNKEVAHNLNALPPMPYQILKPYRYVAEGYWRDENLGLVVSARGCPYSCEYYCPYPLAYGKKIRYRNPEVFVAEVALLNREFGVKHFHFRDQVFTVSEKHVREICQRLIQERLDISWICETRFNLLHSDEMLKEMHAAGCTQIHFGLETGSEELFRAVGKPGTTLEVGLEAFERTRNAGIEVHVHLIVGLPGETWETVRDTAEFLKKAGLNKINLNRAIPYPGTAMHAEAVKEGWIESEDVTRYGSEFVMRTADMSSLELELAFMHLWLGLRTWASLGRRAKLRFFLLNQIVGRGIAARLFHIIDAKAPWLRRPAESTFNFILNF